MTVFPYIGNPIEGYTWVQLADHTFAQDGQFACELNSNSYTLGGWTSGGGSNKNVYKSADLITWNQLPDAPWTDRHTFGQFILNDIAYVVGGDVFTPASDSWKFENDIWTELSSDCGIGNRSLMGSVVHNGDFYLIGGQLTINGTGDLFTTVMKSTDLGVSFSVIQANTPFGNGNCYGNPISFNGYIWVFAGGIYDESSEWFQYQKIAWRSLDGISWECVGVAPFTPVQYTQVIVWDSKIWIMGGNNQFMKNKDRFDSVGNSNQVYCSIDGIEWRELKNPSWEPKHAHSLFIKGSDLILVNGTGGGTPNMKEVWKLSKG